VLIVILTGCVLTELRVTNHTGGQIQFYTGHTKKVKTVPAGATVVVPHTAGKVIIITQNDEVWEYDMVDVPQHVGDVTSGVKKLILSVSVEPDGTIVLPSGTKISPSQKLRVKQ
jgi:tricorn protease-like protein